MLRMETRGVIEKLCFKYCLVSICYVDRLELAPYNGYRMIMLLLLNHE